MERKRVKWLDRDYKWMEQMDFHISSNKSVEELFVKIYTQNQCTTDLFYSIKVHQSYPGTSLCLPLHCIRCCDNNC